MSRRAIECHRTGSGIIEVFPAATEEDWGDVCAEMVSVEYEGFLRGWELEDGTPLVHMYAAVDDDGLTRHYMVTDSEPS